MSRMNLTVRLLTLALAMVAGQLARADQPPNIILCMADDQGWGDTGYAGHEFLRTPHLDRLANSGIRFSRWYSAAPVCSPTRGSCLTGRHPYRYGIRSANVGHIRSQEICLSEILQSRGYATGHFGKWHLGTLTTKIRDSNRGRPGNVKDYAPPWEHGFDVCFSTEAKVPTFDPMKNPRAISRAVRNNVEPGGSYGTAYWTGPDQRVPDDQLNGDDSLLIVTRAVEFIESAGREDKPFFAVVWFHAPHLPVVADRIHRELYPNHPQGLFGQHYSGCISALDEAMGHLDSELRRLGKSENTLLWYCSDNGPEGSAGNDPGSTGPFQGRKRSLYEGGIRVPGFLVWPAGIRAPKTVSAPAVTSDYFPTILDLLNVEIPDRPCDGISLLPLIQGANDRRGRPIGFQSGKFSAWSDERFKLLVSHDGQRETAAVQLFDLIEDPGEQRDVSDLHPERAARMLGELRDWQASCRKSAAGADY